MRALVALMSVLPTTLFAEVSLVGIRDNPQITITVTVAFEELPSIENWRESLSEGTPVLKRPDAGEVNVEYVEIHRQALESHRKLIVEENWKRLGEICAATKRTIDDLLLLSKAKMITQDSYEEYKRTATEILPKCNQDNLSSAYRIAYDEAIKAHQAAIKYASKIYKNCQNLKPFCGL